MSTSSGNNRDSLRRVPNGGSLPARQASPRKLGVTGKPCLLTAAELAEVHAVFDAIRRLRHERTALCNKLDISLAVFQEYGMRRRGRRPRPEA